MTRKIVDFCWFSIWSRSVLETKFENFSRNLLRLAQGDSGRPYIGFHSPVFIHITIRALIIIVWILRNILPQYVGAEFLVHLSPPKVLDDVQQAPYPANWCHSCVRSNLVKSTSFCNNQIAVTPDFRQQFTTVAWDMLRLPISWSLPAGCDMLQTQLLNAWSE
jgi:hypothetical protein